MRSSTHIFLFRFGIVVYNILLFILGGYYLVITPPDSGTAASVAAFAFQFVGIGIITSCFIGALHLLLTPGISWIKSKISELLNQYLGISLLLSYALLYLALLSYWFELRVLLNPFLDKFCIGLGFSVFFILCIGLVYPHNEYQRICSEEGFLIGLFAPLAIVLLIIFFG